MRKDGDNGEYRLMVRFPGEMGLAIQSIARSNHRSINSEIVFRMERAIAAEAASAVTAS